MNTFYFLLFLAFFLSNVTIISEQHENCFGTTISEQREYNFNYSLLISAIWDARLTSIVCGTADKVNDRLDDK